jgi:alginate O-acetyltransferase complex protein AlgI
MLLQGILYCSLFLVCVVVCRRVRSIRTRQAFLLVASGALYLTWSLWFAAVLLTSIAMNFLIGRWMRRKPSASILTLGIASNLLLLGVFKYLPEAAIVLPSSLQRFSHLALPVGLSFWTFQAMSYLFDLYREEELDPSFAEFALYMAFFPVTISGPICRMPDMLPQFRSQAATSVNGILEGLRRIAIGILMVLTAKLMGQGILGGDGIDSGFDHLHRWSGPDVWCLALGYGLQLFFDFAGYSHIAIGAATALGFTVPENFSRPFQSTSPSTFWTRWHMSLSFWIRDYVFLPLATLRREVWWRNLTLVISMLLFGIWHRATWLFVLWGGYHGALLVAHRQLQQLQRNRDWDPPPTLWNPLGWIATLSLVNLGWIFFRARSLSEAGQMWAALISPATYATHMLSQSLYLLVFAIAGAYAISLLLTDRLAKVRTEAEACAPRLGFFALLARWRWYWIPPLYALALIFLIAVTFTHGASAAQFMYDKF